MTVEVLPPTERRRRLGDGTLRFRVGPFQVALRSSLPAVEASVLTLYGGHPLSEDDGAHFRVRVDAPSPLRRVFRPQAQFSLDGREPYIPLPVSMAAPMLEAGLNWCIGTHANQFVVIHSATLERDGRALLMPAPPGSGKSTLCAALVGRGWRLLSDEFALVDPRTGLLAPVPRPVALKDQSIEIIRAWAPELVFGPAVRNNEGQLVAYVRPPASSVSASDERCPPGLVVVPRYEAGGETTATPMTRARAVLHLADSSFNYNFHGRAGFERLAAIADAAPAVTLRYSKLDEGVAAVERLMRGAR